MSYIHGISPEEQRRLALMNDLINTRSLRELALEAGDRVLDLGAGLGQFARSMARVAGPSGRVVGVEVSREQLTSARGLAGLADEAELVDFRHGDAAAPPLRDEEWGTFDVVHTRFLLEHLPDPSSVVRAMVRAARPGGRIVLEDDDHDLLRLWPQPEGIGAVWSAYQDIYRGRGCDPLIGRKLPQLLNEAGASPARATRSSRREPSKRRRSIAPWMRLAPGNRRPAPRSVTRSPGRKCANPLDRDHLARGATHQNSQLNDSQTCRDGRRSYCASASSPRQTRG